MLTSLTPPPIDSIVYPDCDGMPMADNTKQAWWIVVLYGNLTALFREVANIFVAMDLLWYPVKGEPEIRVAPDVLVAFGRPRGHRGSYKQWEEGDVAPQVVFEILSPGNDYNEMISKQLFYEEYGVQEYYVYNPDKDSLVVHLRDDGMLRPKRITASFVSPLLKIRFDLSGPEMVVFGPDGRRFLTFEELVGQRDQAEQRARRLAELSRMARKGHATPEEIQELERLEAQSSPAAP